MPNGSLHSLSPSTARHMSLKRLEAWSATGDSHRAELNRIAKEIVRALHRSTSPSKTLAASVKKLQGFFARREVRGKVNLLNNRHVEFRLAFPTKSNDGLIFCLLYGEINARTAAVKFDLTSPIQMSLHALQRLFERLDNKSDAAVLDEIYSCLGQSIHWHKGATEIKAKCWPLMSANGFFVGTSTEDVQTTTVVTWIKRERMGKKWGVPLDNLNRLKERHPEKLEDFEFAKEFVRSFPWMLHEHVSGEDFIGLAWESRDDEAIGTTPEESDWEDGFINEGADTSPSPKLSSSYISGLNYRDDAPTFKAHSLHTGVVVQRRSSGLLIVGLKNGWVGQVPRQSIERGAQLISGYLPPDIGDDICVVVHKVMHLPNEKAYVLSLDPQEVSDASWANIEKRHPVGACYQVTLISKFNHEFIAQLETGVRGVIPSSEVELFLKQPELYGCSPIGQTLDAVVTGYRSEKRCLILSIRNIESILPVEPRFDLYKSGDQVSGKCIRLASNYALIEISQGIHGLLHTLNNWGEELPKLGNEVHAIVIETGQSNVLVGGVPKRELEKRFFAYPLSEEKWTDFVLHFSVGDTVEVQNLFWRNKAKCFMVVTGNGVVGTMPINEVAWFNPDQEVIKDLHQPGDVFNVSVLKIDSEKKRVIFSKKALDRDLIVEQLSKVDPDIQLLGIVVNTLDYGYFVELQEFRIDALLHITNIPDGRKFIKGESLNVYIDTVDLKLRRVSVKLSPS